MAMSVVLGETLSGQPLEQVAAISPDMVGHIFGQEISLGKGRGLMEMVGRVGQAARRKLQARF